MNREITFRRLSLRPIGPTAVMVLHRLWIDERVRRFLWDGKVVPLEQTQDIVKRNNRLFEDCAFGIWGRA